MAWILKKRRDKFSPLDFEVRFPMLSHRGAMPEPEHPSVASAFPATHWTLVSRARVDESGVRLHALNELLTAYRPALVRYAVAVLRQPPDQGEDLVQGFIAEKIIERQLLKKADRARGRFRSFLLKCFSNYIRSEARRDQAQKRGPGVANIVDFDEHAESLPAANDHAREFDSLWARQVLDKTLENMRRECDAKGCSHLWGIFEYRLLNPMLSGAEPPPYEDLVAQFGIQSPSQGANLLITAKRMFQRVLSETVRETVADENDVKAEITELKKILSSGYAGFGG